MTLITETLISRETLEITNVTPRNSAQYYSNKYLVVDVDGGSSQSIPYPGITLEQVFLGSGEPVIGAKIDLKQGQQLVEMLPLGVYFLRLTAKGAIPKAVVKFWENTGNIYNYFSPGEDTSGGLGNDGLSAYQIAVIEGFEGSQAEWLESLKGEGESAYQAAVRRGFAGTEAQWLDSLKGATGTPGQKGDKGDKGDIGETGPAGQGLENGRLLVPHTATPSAPAAGNTLIYAKSDGQIYKRAAGGNEEAIGTGGGGGGREVLTANRTYFVRTDGNDNNNGLTNTAAGAFLTIQNAFDALAKIDKAGFNVIIQLQDGTYNLLNTINIKDGIGDGTVTLRGNNSNPENVIFSSNLDIVYIDKRNPNNITLEGFKLQNTGNNNNVTFLNLLAGITFFRFLEFGDTTTGNTSSQSHVTVAGGGVCIPVGNYKISGKALFHVLVSNLSLFRDDYILKPPGTPINLTITNNPTINYFAYCYGGTYSVSNQAVSGNINGIKYVVSLNGVITGTNALPGGAGIASLGGQVGG